jgi:hypothetical protein
MTPFTSILFDFLGKDSAYLDPGSGSFIIQLIIASLVGAGFLLRGYWSRIRSYFRGGNENFEEEGEDDSEL